MKQLIILLLVWTLVSTSVNASSLRPTDQITAVGRTIYNSGGVAQPDSIRIQVFRNGTELWDNWYNTGDAECSAIDGWLVFTDQLQDIDGAGGDGHYIILVRAYDADSALYTPLDIQHHDVGVWGEIDGLAGWAPLKDGDSLIIDQSTLEDMTVATVTSVTDEVTANVTKISGDATAADNFETMLDGTGGQELSLGRLAVIGANGGNGSFYVTNSTGPATKFYSSGGNGSGFDIVGHGSGHGIWSRAGLTGHGIYGVGGATSGTGLYGLAQGVGSGISGIGGTTSGYGFYTEERGSDDYSIKGSIEGTITPTDTNSSGSDLAIMPTFWTSADSVGFQGQSGSSDSTSIARAVWNTPQTGHTTAGTFGKYLDSEVSGIGGGTGAYSITLATRDTAAGLMVPNVHLAVRSLDQSSLLAVVATNSYGQAVVNLDADSYVAIATAPGYIFTAYDTVVITGAGTDTISGYQIDPGAPASPSLCRVYGFLYDVTGQPEPSATVLAHLPKGVTRTGTLIVSPFAVETTTDTAGYFYLDLIPSDSLAASSNQYMVTISRTDGSLLRKKITVPATSTWQLVW